MSGGLSIDASAFLHPEDPGWLDMPDWPDADDVPDAGPDCSELGYCVAFLASKSAPVDRSERMQWDDLAELLTTPVVGPKAGRAWMPADIDPGPRGGDRVRSLSLLALDIEAKCEGHDDDKRVIGPEPPAPEVMRAELAARNWRAIIHTTHTHCSEHPRYRVVLDLSRPLARGEVRLIGEHVALLLGVHDACDLKCLEPARLLYLPRIRSADAEFMAACVEGRAVDVDSLMAGAKAASAPPSDGAQTRRSGAHSTADVIGAFNVRWLPDEVLERNGYKRDGKRWMFAGSSSGIPGIVQLPGSDPPRIFSHHGGDPLANGHACDAFECFSRLEHGGDTTAAVRAAADLLGMAGKSSSQGKTEREWVDPKTGEVRDDPIPREVEPVDLWAHYSAPALPEGLLPDVIERFARKHSAVMGADPAGLAMAALTVCATAISDTITLQVKKNDPTWKESARMWVALVGPPSRKKSPIFKAAMRPLRRIDSNLMSDYLAKMGQYEALTNEQRRTAPRPKQKRLLISDATIEAAQEVMKDSPDGILSEQDELSGWFGSMDKFTSGKGSQADRAFYLKSYNGGTYNLNRISRGAVQIPNLSINLLGGIQPEPLRKIANDTVDDGLIQRLLPVILRPASVGRDVPADGVIAEYERLIESLNLMKPPQRGEIATEGHHRALPIRFDDRARLIRERLEHEHLALVEALETVSPKLAAHYGKFDGLFARLCLLWHCIENAAAIHPPADIPATTAERVAKFMETFIRPSAVAFYAGMLGISAGHEELVALAAWIVAKGLTEVGARDAQRSTQSLRHLTADEVRTLCEKLESFGWLERGEPAPKSNTPRWIVNPRVHEQFGDRAAVEQERREAAREALRDALRS